MISRPLLVDDEVDLQQSQGFMDLSCCNFMDKVIQDEDPENEVEAEYRSSNDKVFVWQTRRLLCDQHLEKVSTEKKKEGAGGQNFVTFTEAVYLAAGVPPPVPKAPEADDAAKEKEKEEKPAEEEGKEESEAPKQEPAEVEATKRKAEPDKDAKKAKQG